VYIGIVPDVAFAHAVPQGAHRRRVLVVQDDRAARDAIAERLEGLGVTAIAASDGSEGLERLAEGPPPHAVLLDLATPRLDGHGFLAAMRANERYAAIPVVSTTPATRAPHPARSSEVDELARILASLCEAR
jgi:CheY-like chemotaxis protein